MLRWVVRSSHEGWWLSSSAEATVGYEVRVLPAFELRRRARDLRLAVLKELVADEKLQAEELRATNRSYEQQLSELRAQMQFIEEHVAAQEKQAEACDDKAAEYNAERLQLLEQAIDEGRAEVRAATAEEPGLDSIAEESQ